MGNSNGITKRIKFGLDLITDVKTINYNPRAFEFVKQRAQGAFMASEYGPQEQRVVLSKEEEARYYWEHTKEDIARETASSILSVPQALYAKEGDPKRDILELKFDKAFVLEPGLISAVLT